VLAKAEKAGTREEAEIYNGEAAELMARHSIDSAMLPAGESGPPGVRDDVLAHAAEQHPDDVAVPAAPDDDQRIGA